MTDLMSNVGYSEANRNEKKKKVMEMPGIEPGAFHMQSERSTTEVHSRLQIAQ